MEHNADLPVGDQAQTKNDALTRCDAHNDNITRQSCTFTKLQDQNGNTLEEAPRAEAAACEPLPSADVRHRCYSQLYTVGPAVLHGGLFACGWTGRSIIMDEFRTGIKSVRTSTTLGAEMKKASGSRNKEVLIRKGALETARQAVVLMSMKWIFQSLICLGLLRQLRWHAAGRHRMKQMHNQNGLLPMVMSHFLPPTTWYA